MCRAIYTDIAKPYAEALTADVLPVIGACRWLKSHAARHLAPRRVGGGGMLSIGQSHRVQRVPAGRVAIIATWNYPVQLLGIQLAQALVAGNDVVVKPSEHSPTSQGLLLDLAIEAGLPGGTLTRTAATREAGAELLGRERFDHVVFTGSTEVGRTIARTLADTLTPSTLELSGRDSAIVLADADPELAVKSIVQAFTANAGQTCMAPKRAIVDRAVLGAFLKHLESRLDSIKPRELVTPDAAVRAWDQARDAIDAGAARVGELPPRPEGRALRPIAVLDPGPASDLAMGANFAPTLAVLTADSTEHALAIHSRYPQRLDTAIYTRNVRRARTLAPRLGSTIVTINDAVIPVAHPGVSLGGRGPSGWGTSRGVEGLLDLTRPVYVSATSARVRVPFDPPSDDRARTAGRWIERLFGRGVPARPIPFPTEPAPASDAVSLPNSPARSKPVAADERTIGGPSRSPSGGP